MKNLIKYYKIVHRKLQNIPKRHLKISNWIKLKSMFMDENLQCFQDVNHTQIYLLIQHNSNKNPSKNCGEW